MGKKIYEQRGPPKNLKTFNWEQPWEEKITQN